MDLLIIITYLIYGLLAAGLIFSGLGAIGLLRFPDVYTRLHAGTKCTTLGAILISAAVVIYGFSLWYLNNDSQYIILSVHVIVAVICLLITNPTGAHAIARAAHRSGIMPKRAVVDKLVEAKLK